MADYYPLIARAIAGLDPSASGEIRRALYERARTALITQLRNLDPPMAEADITRERLALEAAVRKVEAEAAQRGRTLEPRPAVARPRSGDALRESVRSTRPSSTLSAPKREPLERPARTVRPDAPRPTPPLEPREPRMSPPPEQPYAPRSLDDDFQQPKVTTRGLRDLVNELDGLGHAPAMANRAAHDTYSQIPLPSDSYRQSTIENTGDTVPYSYDESPDAAADYQPPAPRARALPRGKELEERASGGFSGKRILTAGIAFVVLGLLVLAAVKIYPYIKSASWPSQQTDAPASGDAATRPKIVDRVGQPGSTSPSVASIAQRVVLYDEDPAEPQGKQYVGSVIWRTENVKGTGGKSDIGVRADIEIPERKIKMTFSLRRNNDPTLPASHTAELTFVLPPDFSNGGIANVPGVLVKASEQARGTPLAGLAVKVTDGFFLVGLSNVESDRVRNIQLLKERPWFDIPLVYTNQRRGIIAIEKGAPGERAFTDAFAAWAQ
jgi:hypothetical protein